MRFREAAIGPARARFGVAAMLVAGALLAGCGEDDFANDPRPASPIEITAAIAERGVIVSPDEFGAGLVTITISNQSGDPARLTLDGPTEAESEEIPHGGTGSIKTVMEEGEYEATAGPEVDTKPQTLTVGPARKSSSDELLLP